MDHPSTDSVIASQIGALEWGGDLESYSDGVLESSAQVSGPPTNPYCQQTNALQRCAGDGALEAAGVSMGPPTTLPGSVCGQTRFPCISDSALEAAGASMGPPATMPGSMCQTRAFCISDAALEGAGASMNPPMTQSPACFIRHVDDGALEATGGHVSANASVNVACPPQTALCGH